jgi:hypothetical protein
MWGKRWGGREMWGKRRGGMNEEERGESGQ